MRAILALEDGTWVEGQGFGAVGQRFGEIVFNTGMTGYQELLTDPSYCGQVVIMTYPLIGNYGVNEQDDEARQPFLRGFVVREWAEEPSNWRCKNTVEAYLQKHGIIGISGVDTRALTRKIRVKGTMGVVIARGENLNPEELVKLAQQPPTMPKEELVDEVTTPNAYELNGDGHRIVLMDFGTKFNIARSLNSRGCHVNVVPARTSVQEILALNPDGIMLSNGPGDPKALPYAVETIKNLLGIKPLFGICLGHQLFGLALGGETYKLSFGHRGSNHPVKDLQTGRVYITSQNHGYCVDGESLPGFVEVSHRNMNDGTVEGLRHTALPAFSVQYHPEASPGPDDSGYLFDRFMETIDNHRKTGR